jgi:dihydrofolate synthase/folylpolyglutamate synthase
MNLSDWLRYIESIHPNTIDLTLERIKAVVERLNLNISFPIITVGGTNGKGSTCAILESIYKEAGYNVGCYTSPQFQMSLFVKLLLKLNQQEKIYH